MSRFHAYINPRDGAGVFTGFQEVTEDMVFNSLGRINQSIDNDRFNVGLFTFDSFNFKLRNEHGKYSDIETIESIFRFRRGGSRFKLTWEIQDFPSQCGIAVAGTHKITPEVVVFEGVLNDEAATLDIDDQHITFNALGIDSIFPTVEAPFSSLTNGDLYSDAILTILNQSAITEYLTISAANISVGLDLAIDTIAKFENTTVKESLDRLLFQSNSVLFISDNTVFIESRDGGALSEKTFFGQASDDGIEEIINISNISTGLNNVFNYWTWKDTTLRAINQTSIDSNGLRKKEISFDELTGSSKRQQVLDAQRTEFATKKREFSITVPVSYDNLGLTILDQVRVDYPTVLTPAKIDGEIPLYDFAIYDEDLYPLGEFSITIDSATQLKIMGISIITKNQTMVFKLKEM